MARTGISAGCCKERRKGLAGFAINALTEYPVELCRLLDFFLSEECAAAFYENMDFAYMQNDIPGYEEYTVHSSAPLLSE